ncbi:MAG: hypothetical protein QOJ06_3040 [Pseudonocardiales bacterium]|jgi:hypothetical protein|nr:hypothetical protein [Pseudonocardiales bacterium]
MGAQSMNWDRDGDRRHDDDCHRRRRHDDDCYRRRRC